VDEQLRITYHTLVGELLAKGFTSSEILAELQQEGLLPEEAQSILRGVYDSWISVREGLNLQAEDDRNWHLHLRMKLLQSVLADGGVPSQRLALQILDSLATVQGITAVPEQRVPLQIELVERKSDD